MYDTNAVFQMIEDCFSDADIVIPAKGNTSADEVHHPRRIINLVVFFALGDIGRRNVSETFK
ncbi:hypothetical protein P4S52_06065 [Vibrio sp. SA48]